MCILVCVLVEHEVQTQQGLACPNIAPECSKLLRVPLNYRVFSVIILFFFSNYIIQKGPKFKAILPQTCCILSKGPVVIVTTSVHQLVAESSCRIFLIVLNSSQVKMPSLVPASQIRGFTAFVNCMLVK